MAKHPDPPEAVVQPEEVPVPASGPVVGSWAGLPNYSCPSCPYAALDRGLVEAHISAEHKES